MGPDMYAIHARPCKTQKQKIQTIFSEIALRGSGASVQNMSFEWQNAKNTLKNPDDKDLNKYPHVFACFTYAKFAILITGG